MKTSRIDDQLQKIISNCLIIMSIFILPFHAIDPINTPKLAVLTICGFMCLGVLVTFKSEFNWSPLKPLITVLILFNLYLVLVLITSDVPKAFQFYGTYGRNTGFLTYFSLSIILLTLALVSNQKTIINLSQTFWVIGLISTFYGVIQFAGFDPVPWDNIFSPVIGFLGNPNFQAALLGMIGVIISSRLFSSELSHSRKLLSTAFLVVLLFTILQTDSKQGVLNFLAGFIVVMWIWTAEKGRRKITLIFTSGVCVLGTLVFFGIFNLGPLGEFLYKRSVSARIFYWEAGWKMSLENPLLGVGLDNYGDWYRRSRTPEAAQTFGPDSVSDVAHNVLLDFSSNGGFPLLILYISIITLTIRSIILYVKRQKKFDPIHAGIVGAWVAYQAQSLVSINQLLLVTIGWALSGLLIGIELNSRQTDQNINLSKIREPNIKMAKVNDPKIVLALFVSAALGFSVGAQPMISSVKFRSALESGDIIRIKESAELFPLEPMRIFQVASILRDNKYEKEAIQVLNDGLVHFPQNFLLWRLLSEFPEIPQTDLKRIKAQMRLLDPYNSSI